MPSKNPAVACSLGIGCCLCGRDIQIGEWYNKRRVSTAEGWSSQAWCFPSCTSVDHDGATLRRQHMERTQPNSLEERGRYWYDGHTHA